MNVDEYHKMHALESDYWWHQGRRRMILTLLDKMLEERHATNSPAFLDIGCGTGMLLEDLQMRGKAVGLDFSTLALEYCRMRKLPALGRADVRHLPIRGNSVDIITALDLVEHIKDDVGLLAEFYRVLRPGGSVIISVPAHKNLWSNHDVALHHFRRYEKDEFQALVTAAGFSLNRYTYAMATAYLPAAVFRRFKRLLGPDSSKPATDEFRLPRPINTALLGALKAEASLLRRHDLPFGLSLLCIAEKP